MEYDRRPHHSSVNGLHRLPPEMQQDQQNDKKRRNYKLLVDPTIHSYKGNQKIYRFDGVNPDGRLVDARDPRPRYQRIWVKRQPADLPVPQFKYDQNYVGMPPPKEVTFTNLNDNINKDFLEGMCKGFGAIEEVRIYYHPKNKKHLGIGKVLYTSTKAAKMCVEKLNRTSKMGNIMNVFIDTFGKERSKLVEEKIIERPKLEVMGPHKRDRNSGRKGQNSTDTFEPPDSEYEFNGGSGGVNAGGGKFNYPHSESSYTSHSGEVGHPADMGYTSSTPFSQTFSTPGSIYSGDVHGQNFTPASDGSYGLNHHHSHLSRHSTSRYDMPPPSIGHPPPPQFNSFVGFDPQIPPPPLPSEPPPSTPSSHYQPTPHSSIATPSDHYQDRESSRGRNGSRCEERHRSRHYDRDYDYERDSHRDHDRERDWHRTSHDRDRDHSRDSEGRHGWDRAKDSERGDRRVDPSPPPAPAPKTEKVLRPPSPEPVQEEKPRFMSLESRIQSLLRGAVVEEEDTSHSGRSQEQVHGSPKTPSPSPVNSTNSRFAFNSSRDAAWQDGAVPEPGKGSGGGKGGGGSVGGGGSGSDMDVDDDDRMSLSSISSGEEKLLVNPPAPSALNANLTQPPPNFMVMPPTWPPSFGGYGGFGGNPPFGFGNNIATFQNGMVDATSQLEAEVRQREQESQKLDRKFNLVLQSFLGELKAIMQKDLCKRMVEVSAFKIVEDWWDDEQQKAKEEQTVKVDKPEKAAVPETVAKPAAAVVNEGMSSAIASLFEARHPWTKDGGIENTFGFGGGFSGGLLGIRGGMPRLPSFKKKYRPPSPAEDEKGAEDKEEKEDATREAEDAESDHEGKEENSSKVASGRGRVIYSSDSDEESEDEDKDASAVEDEEEDDEDEDEEEESDEDSEEEEESDASVSSDEEEDDDDVDEEEEEDDKEENERKSQIAQKEQVKVSDGDVSSEESEKEEIDMESEEEEENEEEAGERKSKQDGGKEDSDVDIEGDEGSQDIPAVPAEKQDLDTKREEDGEEEQEEVKSKTSSRSRSRSPPTQEEASDAESEDDKEDDKLIDIDTVSDKEALDEDGAAAAKDADGLRVAPEPDVKVESEEEEGEIRDNEESERIQVMSKDKENEEVAEEKVKENADESPAPPSPVSTPVIPKTKGRGKGRKPRRKSIQTPATTDSVSDLEQSKTDAMEEESSEMDVDRKADTAASSEPEEPRPYLNPAIAEHDYFAAPLKRKQVLVDLDDKDPEMTDSADEGMMDELPTDLYQEVWLEHNYCLPIPRDHATAANLGKGQICLTEPSPPAKLKKKSKKAEAAEKALQLKEQESPIKKGKGKKEGKGQGRTKKEKLKDITNKGSRELASLLPEDHQPKSPVTFEPRSIQEERQVFFDIYNKGIDDEDIHYLKRTYDDLMQSEDPLFYWLNDILWVDHPYTNIPDPPRKRRKLAEDYYQNRTHKTGSSRTDGYYKVTLEEKARYLSQARSVFLATENLNHSERVDESKKKSQSSREVRSETRRLQIAVSDFVDNSDLFKFNQLKTRKKLLRFAKSGIHDWGLFALEPIAADEMVIEYIGAVVRQSMADLREKQYEKSGIGSSYLFRVDTETIIDATMTGNLARFINHSCTPNCYAKVISMESQKKIVIYSKRDIDVNEEITYDYKFPIEDEKIPCLCGTPQCRGTLN